MNTTNPQRPALIFDMDGVILDTEFLVRRCWHMLAAEYGLPIDPVPLPAVGQGGVYYQTHYETWIAAAGFSAAAVLLWLGREQKKKGTV